MNELNKPKTTKTARAKKFYKSKLNLIFTFIASVGVLVINDPLIIEQLSPQTIGYITMVVGIIGTITRTFFTDSPIE